MLRPFLIMVPVGVRLGPPRVALAILLVAVGQSPEEIEPRAVTALRQLRYREALLAFETLLTLHPHRASAHYGKGLALSGLLDYGGAVESLEKAVANDRSYAPAWRQLAILHAQLGQRESAGNAYRRARALAPVPAAERLQLGRALRKAGLLGEAQTVLEGTGKDAFSVEEHLELGLLAMDRGEYRRAAGHLSMAAADPSSSAAGADYEYGRCLEILGEPERAVGLYRRVLEKDSHHRQARFRLGNLLLRQGQEEEGRVLLRGYEQFRQWDRRVKLLLAMISSGTLAADEKKRRTLEAMQLLLEGEALSDAERLIESGLAAYPDEPLFQVARARWLMASGELEETRGTLARLVSQPSPPADARWALAQLHLREGDLSAALEAYRALTALLPDPPGRLLKELATVYAMTGQTEEAREHFEKAIDKDPLLAEVHADLGLLLESEGRLVEAERRYRLALEIDPDVVSAQQGLASLLLQKGEADEAAELFRQSIRLKPRDPMLRRNFALALARLGRTKDAEAEMEKARQLEAEKPTRR